MRCLINHSGELYPKTGQKSGPKWEKIFMILWWEMKMGDFGTNTKVLRPHQYRTSDNVHYVNLIVFISTSHLFEEIG